MQKSGAVIQGCFPRGLPRVAASSAPPVQRHTAPAAPVIQPHAQQNAVQLPPHLAPRCAAHGGQPLPQGVRQMMEAAFGTRFDDVRVHVGAEAQALGATAFTHGSHIHFAPGHYDPASPRGRQTLGRELAHVVQQRAGRVSNPFGSGVAVVHDRTLEAEAERLSRNALNRMPVQPKRVLQRMIGLADLFGVDDWEAGGNRAPAGAATTTVATSANFENLRVAAQIDAAQLVALVPVGCANVFEFESRTQRGFKYQWNDTNGVAWTVWGHEPDAGAGAGYAGGAGWTVRIRRANHYLMDQTINPPVGVAYDWAVPNTPAKVQHSHIALTNV